MCFPLQYTFLIFKNGNPPQTPLPATMTPEVITSALAAAQVLFLLIHGQPSDDNLVCLSGAISSILLKATYDHINSVHNLWGLVASADCYLHHYGAPFVRPATRPACYHLAITAEASHVNRVCSKTAWAALLQDYKAYKAAEHGVKVFIKAVVKTRAVTTFAIPRRFTPTLQPSTSSTIFASIPAAYTHWTWYFSPFK
jgi:hypothetical protein